MPKLAHTKSTRGCKRCKQRKVKCDEVHPVCGACKRHDVLCEFGENQGFRVFTKPGKHRSRQDHLSAGPTDSHFTTSDNRNLTSPGSNGYSTAQSVSPNNNSAANSLQTNHIRSGSNYTHPASDAEYGPNRILELRLMLQFALETSKTMSIGGPDIWKPILPTIGLQHGFLLDIILAWGALHLARTSKDDLEALKASRTYYDRAVKGQTQVIRNDVDNGPLAEALFINSCLIAKFALVLSASGKTEAEPDSKDITYIQWLHISRGLRTIGLNTRPLFVRDGPVHRIVSQQPNLFDEEALFAVSNFEQFKQILEYGLDFETVTSTDMVAYQKALSDIGAAHIAALEGEEDPLGTCRRLLTFASRAEPRFLDMVEEQRPRALVIMAHLFAGFKNIKEQYWWMEGIAERHISTIFDMLPTAWKPMMVYPMQLCGLDAALAAHVSPL